MTPASSRGVSSGDRGLGNGLLHRDGAAAGILRVALQERALPEDHLRTGVGRSPVPSAPLRVQHDDRAAGRCRYHDADGSEEVVTDEKPDPGMFTASWLAMDAALSAFDRSIWEAAFRTPMNLPHGKPSTFLRQDWYTKEIQRRVVPPDREDSTT